MNRAAPVIKTPQWCTDVSAECPVEGTTYGYAPNLAANTFFACFFGIACLLQLFFGIKYKTWTYMTALVCGCLAECVGYIGRIMMHFNAYDDMGFILQVVLLIFAPAFLAAGMYLILKHVVIAFGEEWSRLRPAWYTYIFIGCDISSLVLQSAGGAMAATADDDDESTRDTGTNIMIAGIIWQVVVLVIFGYLVAEYTYKTYRRRHQLSHITLSLWSERRLQLFFGAVVIAYIGILIRCIYRIPELLEGWGGHMMRVELDFIMLESVMIAMTVLAQTVFHPGFCFPTMAGTVDKTKIGAKSISGSDIEMMSGREEHV